MHGWPQIFSYLIFLFLFQTWDIVERMYEAFKGTKKLLTRKPKVSGKEFQQEKIICMLSFFKYPCKSNRRVPRGGGLTGHQPPLLKKRGSTPPFWKKGGTNVCFDHPLYRKEQNFVFTVINNMFASATFTFILWFMDWKFQ